MTAKIFESSEVLAGALIGGCLVEDESRGHCRFEIAAPRHFLYPALLLLLSEEPRHGYRLVDSLLRMGFGPVDRPGIYRALSDLESDGFLRSWQASSTAGSPRQVYDVTEAGAQTLRAWMNVVAEERAALDAVLKRFDNLPGDDGTEFDDG
ncbi:MAG: PadR family transcriptional regulator [Acidimicrobiales bacterium]